MAVGKSARSYSRLRATAREVSGASVPTVYRRAALLVFPVGPVMPRRVLSGDSATGSGWEIHAPDDRRGGAMTLEDRRLSTRNATSWREPPSRPKILRFSAPRSRFFACRHGIVLIHKR